MPINVKIAKYTLNLVIVTLLTSCGGENKSKPINIIFPDNLPKENLMLSQDSPKGIWMIHRIHDVNSNGTKDGLKHEFVSQSTELGISIIDTYNSEIATLPFCTLQDMYEQFEFGITKTKEGYKQSYSTNPSDISTDSQGSLDISFINNRKLIGKGTRNRSYRDGDRLETITIYAVKISDDTNLNTSTDLSYSSYIEAPYDTLLDMDAICIALSDFKAITYENGKKTIENNVQYSQSFALGENDIIGTQIFNTRAMHKEDELQRIGGVLINDSNTISWASNKQCLLDDIECLDKGNLDYNIIKNDHSGIAFSTYLNTYTEGFLNVNISLTINPVINEK